VGVDALAKLHAQQVKTFEEWANSKRWSAFHHEHYDWWAFPIPKRSSYGCRFSVSAEAIAALRARPDFR